MTSTHIANYPCFHSAWEDVCCVMRAAQSAVSDNDRSGKHGNIELEARFGVMEADRFIPGIDISILSQIEQMFDSGKDWANTDGWFTSTVYYHPSSIPGDPQPIRTETRIGKEGMIVESIRKKVVSVNDYRTQSRAPSTKPSQADVRIAISTERPVTKDELPETTQPTSVHIRVRKMYYYVPTNCNEHTWVYVLTKRWVGTSYEDALRNRKEMDPICEVELECTSPQYIMSTQYDHLAVKMLLKIYDIMKSIDVKLSNPRSFVLEPPNLISLWKKPSQ